MADDVQITAGSGTAIATDDDGTRHYQEVKVMVGADGVFTGDVAGRTVDGGSGTAMFVEDRRKVERISVTPTISGTAYAAKDNIGGEMEFVSAARVSGLTGEIRGLVVVDKDQEMANLDLVLFDRALTTTPTDNAIFAPSDVDLANCVGAIPVFTGDYFDFSTNAVASKQLAQPIKCNVTSLFGYLVIREAKTYTSTDDLVVILVVAQD